MARITINQAELCKQAWGAAYPYDDCELAAERLFVHYPWPEPAGETTENYPHFDVESPNRVLTFEEAGRNEFLFTNWMEKVGRDHVVLADDPDVAAAIFRQRFGEEALTLGGRQPARLSGLLWYLFSGVAIFAFLFLLSRWARDADLRVLPITLGASLLFGTAQG